MIETFTKIIYKNLDKRTSESLRLFHGRGNLYKGLEFLTVDSLDKILYLVFFEAPSEDLEIKILSLIKEIASEYNYDTIILQRRYLKNPSTEIIKGILNENQFVVENGLKYNINFKNQNIGLFFDMKNGRDFIKSISGGKKVLNLFSYTCAFSICAIEGGAKSVINVDMSKGALTIGRSNHHLNNHNTKNVQFMPYNILKSWSRIRKEAPYDIIIIDPPSFQKGSFAASNDYIKIVKKLDEISNKGCIVLACLNAPELDTAFLKDIFNTYASKFKFMQRLKNLETFPSKNDEKSLKNLIFVKNK